MMVRQNKWRAARFGLDATLVDSRTHIVKPARQVIRELVERLRPAAEQLECRPYLERVLDVVEKPNWSRRQLDILDQTGDPAEVVRWMTEQSRLTPSGPEGLKSPMDGD
jgi:carboxylate-amine ligase